MTDGRVSVAAGWRQAIFNEAREQAYFYVREFRGVVAVPGSGLQYVFEPVILREHQFLVEIDPNRDLVWTQQGKTESLTSEKLAHRVAMIFFDLIGKVNRGEVEVPYG